MINNFEIIKPLLSFNSEDEFYFVQIIQRKKDTDKAKGSNNSNRLIKAYYISSLEDLERDKDEMIFFANYFNARVGINLNKRSFERTCLNTLKKITDQIINKDYKSSRKAYNSVCGDLLQHSDKNWILDVDHKMDSHLGHPLLISLEKIQPIGNKCKAIIPSKSGFHIITSPFNVEEAKHILEFYNIELHKNNPTNLYIP